MELARACKSLLKLARELLEKPLKLLQNFLSSPYSHLPGIDPFVKEMFYKLASVSLCPPVQGQIMVDLLIRPPIKGEPSFQLYQQEMSTIYDSLKRRAKRLQEAFNELQGVTCNPAQGAMYLFPQICFPQKALQEAKKQNKKLKESISDYTKRLLT